MLYKQLVSISPTEGRHEVYSQKSNLLFVLVVTVLTRGLDRKCCLDDILIELHVHEIGGFGLTEILSIVV